MSAGSVNAAAGGGEVLRGKINEFVGLFFYGTLLKQAREGRMTDSKYGFGGRGEKAFAAQLDLELAQRMGRASGNKLTEAIYDQIGPGRQR